MANKLQFDVSMNNTEAMTGTKEIARAMASLQSTVKNVSKNMASSLTGYSDAIQRNVKATHDYNAEMRKLESAAAQIRSALAGVKEESVAFTILKKESKEAEANVARLTEKLNKLNSTERASGTTAFEKMDKQVEALDQKIQKLQTQKKALESDHYGKAEDIKKYESEIGKAQKERDSLQSKMDAAVDKDLNLDTNIEEVTHQLEQAQSVLEAYNARRDEMLADGSAYSDKSVVEMTKQLGELESQLAAMRSAAMETPEFVESVVNDLNEQVEAQVESLKELQQQREELAKAQDESAVHAFGNADDYDTYGKNYDTYSDYIAKNQGEIEELENRAEELRAQIEEIRSDGDVVNKASTLAELEDELSEAESRLEQYYSFVEDWQGRIRNILVKAFGSEEAAAEWESGENALTELDGQIDQTSEKIDELQDKIDSLTNAGGDLEGTVDIAEREVAGEKEDVENAQAAPTANLDSVNDSVRAASSFLDEYMRKWNQMISVSSMARNAMATAITPILHPIQAADRALGMLIVKAGQMASSFARMAGSAALSFLRRLASEAQNAAIQLAKLASNAVHGAFQKLAHGAAAAGRGLIGLVKHNNTANGSFKRSFTTILKYAFGVRSMYYLFRRLRTAVKEAFTEMAKTTPEVNSAIKGLQSALNGLKGSLATAFSPIFTAVAPALTYLINLLTAAMNTLGAFFSALTGGTSFRKSVGGMKSVSKGAAKSSRVVSNSAANSARTVSNSAANGMKVVSNSAADGMKVVSNSTADGMRTVSNSTAENVKVVSNGAADSAKNVSNSVVDGVDAISKSTAGASKKAEELKRELMGFDELNILNDDNENSSGGGGGGGGGSGGMSFVEEQIPEGIKSFVDKLKELWNNKEYVKLGKLIADWINKAIAEANELITWENVSTKIQGFVDAVAGIMEGLLTYIDWVNIGDTIAEGLRTVVNTIDSFMQKVGVFILAGVALAALVNGFFKNETLWTDIGKTITDSVHAFLSFGQAFLDGFDAEEAGRGVRSAILTVAEKLPEIAAEFWELVKTAFKKAGSFVNALLGGSDGEEGEEVDISNLVRLKPLTFRPKYTVDGTIWDDLAETLSTGFNMAANLMRLKPLTFRPKYTVDGTIWDDLAETLSTGFNMAVKKVTAFINDLHVGSAVAALAGWIIKVKNGINWEAVGTVIGSAFRAALDGLGAWIDEWGADAETFGAQIASAINGFVDAAFDSGTISSHFTTAVKSAFSFLQAFLEKLNEESIAEKLREAITGIDWDGIANAAWEAFKTAVSKLGNFLTLLLGDDAEPDISKYTRKRPPGMENEDSSQVTSLAQAIGKAVSSAIDAFDKWLKGIDWAEIGAGFGDFLSNLPWDEWATRLAAALQELFNSIREFFAGLVFGKEGGKTYAAYKRGETTYGGRQYQKAQAGEVPQEFYDEYAKLAEQVRQYVENTLMSGGFALDISQALNISGWETLSAETQYAYFLALQNSFGAAATYDYLKDQGKEVTAAIAEGIKSGDITVDEDESGNAVLNFMDGTKEVLKKDGEEVKGLFEQLGVDSVAGLTTAFGNEQESANTAITETMNGIVEAANEAVQTGSPSKVFEELGNNIVAGLILGLGTLPAQLQTIWDSLPEWARTMFTSLGQTLGIEINANSDGGNNNGGNNGGASDKDTNRNTKASKRETKETKKNTKELKKNTAKRGEVDVNYEGAGFDTSSGKPRLNVGVDFVPGDDTEPSDENKNGGLLGWLQELLNADSLSVKIALIRDNWESVVNWMYENGFIGDTLMQLINLAKEGKWKDVVDWFEQEQLIGPTLAQLLKLAIDGQWTDVIDWLTQNGYFGDTLAQLIKLAKEGKWTSVIDWFDTNGYFGPALAQVVKLAKEGKWKDVLDWFKDNGYLSENIDQLVDLVKAGDWMGVIDWFTKNNLFGPKLQQLVDLIKAGDWEGVIDWLEDNELFGPALQQLVGLIKDGDWDGVIGWLEEQGWFGEALAQLVGLVKDGEWTGVIDWLEQQGLFGDVLAQLIGLAKDGDWASIIGWLKDKGLAGPAFEQLVTLVKNNWETFLGFLGIDTSNPLIQTLVNLLFGDNSDEEAKEILETDNTEVSVGVNLNKGEPGTVDEVYSASDKLVTGKTMLEKGGKKDGAQTVDGAYDAEDKKVIGKTALEKGGKKNGEQTVSGAYSAEEKQVTGKTALTKGGKKDGTQTVSGAYSAEEKQVTGKTALVKGGKKEGVQKVEGAYSAEEKQVTGKTALKKGNKTTGAQAVDGLYSDGAKKVTGKTALKKGNKATGAQAVDGLYSDSDKKVTGKTQLKKGNSGSQAVDGLYSDSAKKVTGKTRLKKGTTGNQSAAAVYGEQKISVSASLQSSSAQALKSAATKAMKGIHVTVHASASSSGSINMRTQSTGGVIANGMFHRFASGGIISGGMARYLKSVPHYAGGTTKAHGTVFVAGEAGPEIMGHINGRTEVLNKSQIAEAIYSAVTSAMSTAVNAFGKYIANHMTNCTNSIVRTIAANAGAVSGVDYYAPATATGGVMPYDVAMQIARSTQALQNTLDANNEDLIQAMVSAVGNAAQSIVQAMLTQAARGNQNRTISTRTVVNDINRAGQMFGQSPIRGV